MVAKVEQGSEPGWASILETLPVGLLLADAEGRWTGVNAAACRILGLPREALLGGSMAELCGRCRSADGSPLAPGAAPELAALGPAALRSGQPCGPTLCAWTREDGAGLWLEWSAEPQAGGGVLVLVTEVTDRVEAERALREQAGHLERLQRLYACLGQVNQAIVWSSGREALLAKICEVMVTFGKFSMAWIGWAEPGTQEIRVLSHYGDHHGYLEELRVRADDSALGRGASGRALREGCPVVNNDFLGSAQAAPWHDQARRSGFAASAALPLRVAGAVAGTLNVYAPVAGFFGTEELDLLVEAAGDLSYALDHLEGEARRKAAEADLVESVSQFQVLFETAPVGMAIVDSATGRFLSVNPRLGEILGWAPQDLLRARFQDFTHPEHVEPDQASVKLLVDGLVQEVQKEKRFIHRSGHEVWARLKMVRLPGVAGAAPRHFSLVENITEAHHAQAALKDALDRLQKITDRLPGVVYQYRMRPDGTTHMPFVSGAIRQLYRLEPEDLVQDMAKLNAVEHPDDDARITASRQASARTLSPWKEEYRLRFADGEVRHVYVDAVPEREEDGAILWTGCITDITERKHLEAQYRHAQNMESLGSLAGGVAHDMNNVLGAILALASAHQALQPRDSPAHQAFDTIRLAATRGGDMVRTLLNFARKDAGVLRPLDLNGLLRDQARLLERTTLARVRLDLDLEPALRPVLGDGSALANAIMNLCVNAVDAMGGNGTLALRTRNLDGDRVELRVEDTGSGMSQEVLDRALDPFFTTKAMGKGTGLGLAMVYTTVKAHQGELELQSEPGRGTRVRVVLPATAALEAPLPDAPGAPAPVPGQGLQVLLVDDDELVRKSTGMLLELLGHWVVCAQCGEEALALVENGLRPGLVLLDLNMPGLGGAGTLPPLRALLPGVPVLLATGRAEQEAEDLVASHPPAFLLAKPFSFEDLQGYLERLRG